MSKLSFGLSLWLVRLLGSSAIVAIALIFPDIAQAEILGTTGFESNCQRKISQVVGRIDCGGLRYGLQATRELEHSFEFVSSPVANGDWSARFELRSDDTYRDTSNSLPIRSEIIFDTGMKTGPGGDDIWYAYKVRLESFTPDNSWEIIGQGAPQHGHWNGGCDSGPPNFSFSPVQLESRQFAWSFALRHSPPAKCRTHKNTVTQLWTFDEVPFQLNSWVDVVVNLKSTHEPDGYARIWINGVQVLDYQGPSGFYMVDIPISSQRRTLGIKPAGIYKRGYNNQLNSKDRSEKIVVYLDDVVFAKNSSYEEVATVNHSEKRYSYLSQILAFMQKFLQKLETT